MFLLVPAHPGSLGQRAVSRSLLLFSALYHKLYSCLVTSMLNEDECVNVFCSGTVQQIKLATRQLSSARSISVIVSYYPHHMVVCRST